MKESTQETIEFIGTMGFILFLIFGAPLIYVVSILGYEPEIIALAYAFGVLLMVVIAADGM